MREQDFFANSVITIITGSMQKKKKLNKDNFVQMQVITYLHKSSCARNTFVFFFYIFIFQIMK